MTRTMTSGAALAAALGMGACATTGAAPSGPAAACGRECLIGVADAYLASLVAHDPTQAPLADDVVIVENAMSIEPGDGLWDTASTLPTEFALYVPDPVVDAVGFLGVMQVEGTTRVVALRLQLEGGAIVEAEHLVTNAITGESQFGAGQLENLKTPRPGLLTEIPEGERLRRDQLISIGGTYYDALEGERGAYSPFADDCERRENGIRTAYPGDVTGMDGNSQGYFSAVGCSVQLDTGVMGYIDHLTNRRVFAADPETGLVMGLSHFRHSMTNKTIPIFGVEGVTERPVNFNAFDLPAAHVFKVGPDGEIHEIEAMGFQEPYLGPTGWPWQ
jgi:hypothetical protein